MIEFSLIPWDSGDVLSQAVWRGGVMCTFSFYKDHPGKTGSRETSERLAIIPVKIIKALTELVIIAKKRRGWMREVKGLEFTGIGGCGMGGEVWEGCWVSLDFWIGWCWCLVRWGRKSSLGWVFRSSVQDCCIWGSVGPPGGARGLGSSYIEEPLSQESPRLKVFWAQVSVEESRIDETGRKRVRKKNLWFTAGFRRQEVNSHLPAIFKTLLCQMGHVKWALHSNSKCACFIHSYCNIKKKKSGTKMYQN